MGSKEVRMVDKEDWKIVGVGLLIAIPLCLLNGIMAGVIYWIFTTIA